MASNTIEQLLTEILAEQLGEKVPLEKTFDELGMDSLDFMEFINAVRETVGEITDKETFTLHSPRDVANLLSVKAA